jgi:hypothetical protein
MQAACNEGEDEEKSSDPRLVSDLSRAVALSNFALRFAVWFGLRYSNVLAYWNHN